jgi:hypothetical protein
MLIDLTCKFLYEVLVKLLLRFLHLREKVHDLTFAGVGHNTPCLLDNLLGDRDITTHILRTHLLKALLLVLKLGLYLN